RLEDWLRDGNAAENVYPVDCICHAQRHIVHRVVELGPHNINGRNAGDVDTWDGHSPINACGAVASPVTVIESVASEADWVGLEEAAEVGGVEAVAQVIQAQLLIPLLPGEEMTHPKRARRELVVVRVVEHGRALQIVPIPFP